MTEMKRGPGRPPKVRPEAVVGSLDELPVVEVLSNVTRPEKIESVSERKVEIELTRKYVPDGQPQEIKQSVPAGTVISLPQWEATRALKLGIARATDRTFD
jgi:hypothetical protein